jgi:hypothetical protein
VRTFLAVPLRRSSGTNCRWLMYPRSCQATRRWPGRRCSETPASHKASLFWILLDVQVPLLGRPTGHLPELSRNHSYLFTHSTRDFGAVGIFRFCPLFVTDVTGKIGAIRTNTCRRRLARRSPMFLRTLVGQAWCDPARRWCIGINAEVPIRSIRCKECSLVRNKSIYVRGNQH